MFVVIEVFKLFQSSIQGIVGLIFLDIYVFDLRRGGLWKGDRLKVENCLELKLPAWIFLKYFYWVAYFQSNKNPNRGRGSEFSLCVFILSCARNWFRSGPVSYKSKIIYNGLGQRWSRSSRHQSQTAACCPNVQSYC